ESFAVWCSTCLRQQKEMARLIELAGDAIVHVSLDTDPNEDIDKVLSHTQRNEFAWLFAIAPIDMTQALIADFGLTVVNAPRAPVILIAADGTARLLPNGVKTAEELLEEIGELPESPAEDGENS
ncbi:TlpA family protein disulfide reductase, partial [Candidatus Bipolaricaulota bacterium]